MLCQICGKNPATVHFTEIHDNQMTELHVCERVRRGEGPARARRRSRSSTIADLLAGMVDGMTDDRGGAGRAVQCPRCGMLYSAFKETGRLGCAECYDGVPVPSSRPLLRRIHGDTRHVGKVPARDGEGAPRSRQIQRLHDELQRAVEREEFERAAEIRDEIKRLEREAQRPRTAEPSVSASERRRPRASTTWSARPSPWLDGERAARRPGAVDARPPGAQPARACRSRTARATSSSQGVLLERRARGRSGAGAFGDGAAAAR